MEINKMRTISTIPVGPRQSGRNLSNERGAALITVLLISVLLLVAGGALIMTTSLAATSTFDSTAEVQSYYAAEAGMQESLAVLRGHVGPLTPVGNATDKITYTQAVSIPTLSKWLAYSNTFNGSRVILTNPATYSVFSGMAYTANVTDPDNYSRVEYTVSGLFPNSTRATKNIIDFGGGANKATLTYTAPAPVTGAAAINGTGNTTLGSFAISGHNGTVPAVNEPFVLTITQTLPYASTFVVNCMLIGDIASPSTSNPLKLLFQTQVNNIGGVIYSRTASSFPVSLSAVTPIPVTVTAPEPNRVVVKVTGYGPRGATKKMQMLVSRFAFDFKPNSTITIRGADSGISADIQIGSSSQYTYTGNDQSGGANLPAFAVTNGTDYSRTLGIIPTGGQVTGAQQVSQTAVGDLASFLQTANSARAFLEMMRGATYNSDPALNRYFTSSPSDFGASAPNGLTTFVDGDAALPPAGGAGLLIVTGTLDMRGSAEFKGLILVLGKGEVLRNGGGNGVTLGSLVVAKFDSTGDFLAPTFNSNGGGTSDVKYDSIWVEKALRSAGPRVMGVSEY
jgi:hypothetical protein